MTQITIAGAGIAGPAAALTLTHAGHDVTVYEKRQPDAVASSDVIGITEVNCGLLAPYGAKLDSIALDNLYYEWTTDGMEMHRFSTQKFVVWTDVHKLLIQAAKNAGARFTYGQAAPITGVVIHASGLGYASSRGLKAQPRYLVYRGLSSVPTDFSWLSMNDPGKQYSFKVAHTPYGTSWTLYVHRPCFPLQTSKLDPKQLPEECALLPDQFRRIVDRSITLQTSAISDWECAQQLRICDDGRVLLTLGDANGGMRPHTGSGANLGIQEAICAPHLLDGDDGRERFLVAARWAEHDRGITMGQELMGV